MKSLSSLLGLILLLSACTADQVDNPLDKRLQTRLSDISPNGNYSYFLLPDPQNLADVPNQDPQNPLTKEKVELGKMLFFETGLAQNPMHAVGKETYSCATCHLPERGFTPGRVQGVADGGAGYGDLRQMHPGYSPGQFDAQGARPISVLNVAYVTNTFWNGQFGAEGVNEGTENVWDEIEGTEVNFLGLQGLEAQNIEGLHAHRMEVNEKVLDEYGYREMFDVAFPEIDEEYRYHPQYVSFAISAYLRTLITSEAPFQQWLRGDEYAMTNQQKKGALLFFDKAKCFRCHKSPSLNSMEFHALGTPDLYVQDVVQTGPSDRRNLGRGGFTLEEEDMFKFKVPQLYNVKDYVTYFHGSSKDNLEDVLHYKLKAISQNPNVPQEKLSPKFTPVSLSDDEVHQLLDFLKYALHDNNYQRFVPEEVLSGNCFPNNDDLSRLQLGCD